VDVHRDVAAGYGLADQGGAQRPEVLTEDGDDVDPQGSP
jgi:hypothetical protein